ncbi:MAG: site-specific DNA-methyltransferase [Syntrophobacter sp.]
MHWVQPGQATPEAERQQRGGISMTGTTPNVDTIIQGDCLEEMKKLPDRSIDAIVTDPPYELAFMGKKWDASGIAYNVDMWGECLRVLKPGGHLLAFGGARTYHRMACAIEDAGFEIRDSLHWVYSQGFPKSLDISKAIDKAAKAEREIIGEIDKLQSYGNGANSVYGDGPDKHHRMLITSPSTPEAKQWSGYGSALKPAHEPIVLARKPLDGCTIAENVLRWGCGGLNIDGSRVSGAPRTTHKDGNTFCAEGCYSGGYSKNLDPLEIRTPGPSGRFPSNLIHDNSPEVLAEFAKAGERKSGARSAVDHQTKTLYDGGWAQSGVNEFASSSGSASRFFMACEFTPADYAPIVYYAKAAPSERNGSTHPTMKPLSLMRYLCKLITPPGGTILDPFGGSGTTGIAAMKEGFHYILIEQQAEYCEIARKRVAAVPARLDRWAEAEG